MKKNLFVGVAALMLCGVFTSCSHDVEFDEQGYVDNVRSTYEQAFKARFGTPAPNQDWGFGTSANVRTRSGDDAPVPTYVGPTFNAKLAAAGIYNWANSGWVDAFYQIDAKPVASTYSDEKLAELKRLCETLVPEGQNNLANAKEAGYTMITKGGPVTLTPIYHESSSGDLVSYYYYPKDSKPSVADIKTMKKYTIGYISDPNICKDNIKDFHHTTFSLVYYDEATGKASYSFPPNYEINFIISNVDYAHPFDITIGPGNTIQQTPEYYGDGDLNETIHGCVQFWNWNLPACEGEITDNKTPHAAVFSIGENNYVGFEDWTDFDYNDVLFEVKGTGGGTVIPPVDEWEEMRVIAEDLSVEQSTDFDFNDVVFDVRRYTKKTAAHELNEVEVILRAAGGTLPLYVADYEVHEQFGVDVDVMVNTKAQSKGLKGADKLPVTLKLTSGQYSGSTIGAIANSIKVYVIKDNVPCYLYAPEGEIASKIGVGCDYEWCDERQDIDSKYYLTSDTSHGGTSLFKNWVQGIHPADTWYQYAYDSIYPYPAQ